MSLVLLYNPKKLKKKLKSEAARECFFKYEYEGNVLGFTEETNEELRRQLEQHLKQLLYPSEEYISGGNMIDFIGKRIIHEINPYMKEEGKFHYQQLAIMWKERYFTINGEIKKMNVLKSFSDNKDMRYAFEKYLLKNIFKHIEYIGI